MHYVYRTFSHKRGLGILFHRHTVVDDIVHLLNKIDIFLVYNSIGNNHLQSPEGVTKRNGHSLWELKVLSIARSLSQPTICRLPSHWWLDDSIFLRIAPAKQRPQVTGYLPAQLSKALSVPCHVRRLQHPSQGRLHVPTPSSHVRFGLCFRRFCNIRCHACSLSTAVLKREK